MDFETGRLLKQGAPSNEEASDTFDETLADVMEQTYANTRSWGEVIVDSASGLNVIAFSSGWGDGTYDSYWGLNSGGEAVCLLTDFRVVRTYP